MVPLTFSFNLILITRISAFSQEFLMLLTTKCEINITIWGCKNCLFCDHDQVSAVTQIIHISIYLFE